MICHILLMNFIISSCKCQSQQSTKWKLDSLHSDPRSKVFYLLMFFSPAFLPLLKKTSTHLISVNLILNNIHDENLILSSKRLRRIRSMPLISSLPVRMYNARRYRERLLFKKGKTLSVGPEIDRLTRYSN